MQCIHSRKRGMLLGPPYPASWERALGALIVSTRGRAWTLIDAVPIDPLY